MTADGAYDGEAVYDAVAERHPSATVIIPSRATSIAGGATATQRDRHLTMSDEPGWVGGRGSGLYGNSEPWGPIMHATGAADG